MLGLVLDHPNIIPAIEEDLSFLPLPAELDRLRAAIWDWAAAAEVLDSAELLNHLRASGLAEIAAGTARVGAIRPGGGRDDVVERPEEQWRHFFGFFRTDALRAQVAEEERRCAQNLTPESQNRVLALRAELLALERGEHAVVEDG